MPAFILCLDDHAALASILAEQLSQQQPVSVLPLERRHFPDGELYFNVPADVQGADIIVLCHLHQPGEKALALWFMARHLRDMGARRIGLVAPYLAYMRQDIRFQPGECLTSKYFANNVIPLAAMNLMGKAMPRGQDMLTGARPCYSLYKTADNRYMAVGALEQKFWHQLCDVLAQPDWKSRYHDMGPLAEQLRAEVAAVFAAQPQAHWREVFAATDCCVTPVLTPQQVFEHPQLLAREMVQTLTTPQGQTLRCPATPFCFNEPKPQHLRPGPQQGEHSVSILQNLGITDTQIQQWQQAGVIRTASEHS